MRERIKFTPFRLYLTATIFIHELGHLIAVLLVGYKVTSFRVGEEVSERRLVGLNLADTKFDIYDNFPSGKVEFVCKEDSRLLPLVFLAGPLAEILVSFAFLFGCYHAWVRIIDIFFVHQPGLFFWFAPAALFLVSIAVATALVLGVLHISPEIEQIRSAK